MPNVVPIEAAKPAAYWVLLALLSPVFLAVGLGFLTRH